MAKETLVVENFAGLIKGLRDYDRGFKTKARLVLRQVGESTRADAASAMAPINQRTASGYKVRLRQRGIEVEQSIPKTTGRHPEYGAFQMVNALLPARHRNAPVAEREFERALDTLAAQFNHGGVL
jgi:hypothetical protein